MKEYQLTYQKNIRDLGGLVGHNGMKVKTGRLFRGGFLDCIAPEDEPILKSFHLTDVIDFRSEDEFKARPDYRLEGVKYHNYPPMEDHIKRKHNKYTDGNLLWFVEKRRTGYQHMCKAYEDLILSDAGKKAFTNFFKLLLSKDDGVFYFHCAQGKDRAGMAAYMLEIALGVSEEVAKEDYLLSNKAMVIRIEELLKQEKNKKYYSKRYHDSLIDVFSAKLEYLQFALRAAEKISGSMLNYIIEILGVDIDKLRAIYLE